MLEYMASGLEDAVRKYVSMAMRKEMALEKNPLYAEIGDDEDALVKEIHPEGSAGEFNRRALSSSSKTLYLS